MTDNKLQPLVSVIVPVYKVENYIKNCLESLINQTYLNWEAILVDDGSPDRSGEICEEYAVRDRRFKVIHKNNGGQSSARNLAMEYVSGDYIFYLDSDDFLAKEALECLCSLALNNKADIVQCDYVRGTDVEFPNISEQREPRIYDNHSVFTEFVAKIIPCGKLYHRNVIGDMRFPEGLINEDDFTVWKYYYNANLIVVTDRPLYYYTMNPGSTMAQKIKRPDFRYFDAYRERIAFFKDRNEIELESVSRIQWMKSLVMTYSNPMLTTGQKKDVADIFKTNYNALKMSEFKIPTKLAVVFRAFDIAPMLTSKTVMKIYNR